MEINIRSAYKFFSLSASHASFLCFEYSTQASVEIGHFHEAIQDKFLN